MTLSHAGTGTLDLEVVPYAHRLRFDDLPPSTVERTKMLVLDTSGAAIAAVGADGVEAVDARHLPDRDSRRFPGGRPPRRPGPRRDV